jgi:hypothetical protein
LREFSALISSHQLDPERRCSGPDAGEVSSTPDTGHWVLSQASLTVLIKSGHYAHFFKQEVNLDGRTTGL